MQANRENWRSIDGFNNYEVSDHGRVRNVRTSRILTQLVQTKGYLQVQLFDSGKPYKRYVHRLVCQEFLPNTENKGQVDHIDGDKTNNHHTNLRWCSSAENNCNKGLGKRNKSGYKGVHYDKQHKKYRAMIVVDGKTKHLGYFQTEHDAARAYNDAARMYHGDFAKLNDI